LFNKKEERINVPLEGNTELNKLNFKENDFLPSALRKRPLSFFIIQYSVFYGEVQRSV